MEEQLRLALTPASSAPSLAGLEEATEQDRVVAQWVRDEMLPAFRQLVFSNWADSTRLDGIARSFPDAQDREHLEGVIGEFKQALVSIRTLTPAPESQGMRALAEVIRALHWWNDHWFIPRRQILFRAGDVGGLQAVDAANLYALGKLQETRVDPALGPTAVPIYFFRAILPTTGAGGTHWDTVNRIINIRTDGDPYHAARLAWNQNPDNSPPFSKFYRALHKRYKTFGVLYRAWLEAALVEEEQHAADHFALELEPGVGHRIFFWSPQETLQFVQTRLNPKGFLQTGIWGKLEHLAAGAQASPALESSLRDARLSFGYVSVELSGQLKRVAKDPQLGIESWIRVLDAPPNREYFITALLGVLFLAHRFNMTQNPVPVRFRIAGNSEVKMDIEVSNAQIRELTSQLARIAMTKPDRITSVIKKISEREYKPSAGLEEGEAERARPLPPEEARSQIKQFLKALEIGREQGYQKGAIVDLRKLSAEKRVLFVGDQHTSPEVLTRVIRDEGFEKDENALLIVTGDALHPEKIGKQTEMDSSIRSIQQIMDLKIRHPTRFYYLLGNHDWPSFRIGTAAIGDRYFSRLREDYGRDYEKQYRQFLTLSPILAVGDRFVAVHAGPILGASLDEIQNVRMEDILLTDKKANPILYQALFGSNIEGIYPGNAEKFLNNLGLPLHAQVISSHYHRPDAWWHQLLLTRHYPRGGGTPEGVNVGTWHNIYAGSRSEIGQWGYARYQGGVLEIVNHPTEKTAPAIIPLRYPPPEGWHAQQGEAVQDTKGVEPAAGLEEPDPSTVTLPDLVGTHPFPIRVFAGPDREETYIRTPAGAMRYPQIQLLGETVKRSAGNNLASRLDRRLVYYLTTATLQQIDSHSDAESRGALTQLKRLIDEAGVASSDMLVEAAVRHLTGPYGTNGAPSYINLINYVNRVLANEGNPRNRFILPPIHGPEDITALNLWGVKEGDISSVFRTEVVLRNGKTVYLAVNVAKDRALAADALIRDYKATVESYARDPRFIMQPYGLGVGVAAARDGKVEIQVMVGEWLDGFHELHLYQEDRGRFAVWLDQRAGRETILSSAESGRIWNSVRRLQRFYYGEQRNRRLFSEGLINAGDFVARKEGASWQVMMVWRRADIPAAGLEENRLNDSDIIGLAQGDVGANIRNLVRKTITPVLDKPGWRVEFETAISGLTISNYRLPETHLVRGAARGTRGRDWWIHLHLIQASELGKERSADVRHGLLFQLELDGQGHITGIGEVLVESDPTVMDQPFVSLKGIVPDAQIEELKTAAFQSIRREESGLSLAMGADRYQFALAESQDRRPTPTWLMARVRNRDGESIRPDAFLLSQSGVYRVTGVEPTERDRREFREYLTGLEKGSAGQEQGETVWNQLHHLLWQERSIARMRGQDFSIWINNEMHATVSSSATDDEMDRIFSELMSLLRSDRRGIDNRPASLWIQEIRRAPGDSGIIVELRPSPNGFSGSAGLEEDQVYKRVPFEVANKGTLPRHQPRAEPGEIFLLLVVDPEDLEVPREYYLLRVEPNKIAVLTSEHFRALVNPQMDAALPDTLSVNPKAWNESARRGSKVLLGGAEITRTPKGLDLKWLFEKQKRGGGPFLYRLKPTTVTIRTKPVPAEWPHLSEGNKVYGRLVDALAAASARRSGSDWSIKFLQYLAADDPVDLDAWRQGKPVRFSGAILETKDGGDSPTRILEMIAGKELDLNQVLDDLSQMFAWLYAQGGDRSAYDFRNSNEFRSAVDRTRSREFRNTAGLEEGKEMSRFLSTTGNTVELLLETDGGAVPLHKDFVGQPAVVELAGKRGEVWAVSTTPLDSAKLPKLAMTVFIQPEYRDQVEAQLQEGIKQGWIHPAETVLEKGAVVIGDKAYRNALGETPYTLGQIFVEIDGTKNTVSQITPGFLERLMENLNPIPGEVVVVQGRFEAGADTQAAALVSA